MTILSLLLVGFALYYAALMGGFAWGFQRITRQPPDPPSTDAWPFVSVLVPARNEEASIEACLQALLENDYPAARCEIIVIDDFSDDGTVKRVRAVQHAHRAPVPAGADAADAPVALRLIRMADHTEQAAGHKRAALAQGIAAARGEIILTTDADCTAGPHWLRTMVAQFTPDTAFVSGPVLYRTGQSLFGDLQTLEFLGLVAVGAGAIGIGRPNLCNSANVAYRRDVYDALHASSGGHAISPGDDEMLLQRIAAETDWQVNFCAAPAASVTTDPASDLQSFWNQRRRWAATGAQYPGIGLTTLIAAVYVFYLLLGSGALAALFAPALWPAVGGALALKVASEGALLYPAARHFGRARLFRYFLPEQFLQIPYVICIGLAGAVAPPRWKGRRIR